MPPREHLEAYAFPVVLVGAAIGWVGSVDPTGALMRIEVSAGPAVHQSPLVSNLIHASQEPL